MSKSQELSLHVKPGPLRNTTVDFHVSTAYNTVGRTIELCNRSLVFKTIDETDQMLFTLLKTDVAFPIRFILSLSALS